MLKLRGGDNLLTHELLDLLLIPHICHVIICYISIEWIGFIREARLIVLVRVVQADGHAASVNQRMNPDQTLAFLLATLTWDAAHKTQGSAGLAFLMCPFNLLSLIVVVIRQRFPTFHSRCLLLASQPLV